MVEDSTERALFTIAEPHADPAALLEPRVAAWFRRTYADFTEAQKLCISAILEGRSILLNSPTGTGKTLAGFLSIIDWLVREPSAANGAIAAIYVSPLRALTYDIHKNLEQPLREMGLEDRIRVGLRTGDTPAKDRARMRKRPPQILLTTPESLAVLLAQRTYQPALAACRYVIVDELHALAENKRGTHLSLTLERLERLRSVANPAAPPLCRVGLSATIGAAEGMAAFLVGVGRPCLLATAAAQRDAEIEVFSPLRRDPYPPAVLNSRRVIEKLCALVRAHRSVLIFANTRAGAENLGLALKAALPEFAGQVEVHHSSLDRAVRLEVEDRLKKGEMRAVVCSTSLELGIDIGAIDLVVMISSPKGISRALQRLGRAGHSIHQVSRALLVATDVIDLVECVVTARLMREHRCEPVHVVENAADVLAQQLVGMAMSEPGIRVEEAWALVRRSWSYRRLERATFDRVLEYLQGGGRSLAQAYSDTFGKLIVRDGALFTVSPKVEREYLVNIGTIVAEGYVDVVLKRRRLGSVEEHFIEHLSPGDVFVLGGRAVRLVGAGWQVARVEDARGERPNVPAWSSHRIPLADALTAEIGRLRTVVDDFLAAGRAPDAVDWLVEQWQFSLAAAHAVVAQFELQRRFSEVPRDGSMLIEHYRGDDGRSHYFFHSAIGLAANDTLSRIAARRVARFAGGNARVTADDYGFLLTLRRFQELPLERWRDCLARANAEDDLRAALRESELVRGQFRAVAQTGLMVPRQWPSQDRALPQLRFSTEILFRVLEEHEPDHPMLLEAYRQASEVVLDLAGARAWMEKIARPDWQWRLREVPVVSPFGMRVFANHRKENMMFEAPGEAIDRWMQQSAAGSAA